ncbi:SNF2 family N-terminal domain-containing protein [Podospora didyma]|uniref:SNF2 family N-terminal domain-containing protein n=1 Tax=Podospora didyma TaxID=330526 RepID=A0AAE0NC53_9PEZI|nr:SNF2 family N-terminal domain-containing protein [Podospora didyma]
MPRTKATARRPVPLSVRMREAHAVPGSQAQNMATFLEMLRSIPQEAIGTDPKTPERPVKRAKTTGRPDAICIAREHLTLPTHPTTVSQDSSVITRHGIGELIALRTTTSELGFGGVLLCISPRVKSRAHGFDVFYVIEEEHLSKRLVSALDLAKGYDPREQGGLWAAVSITARQSETTVEVELGIEIWWNLTRFPWNISQTQKSSQILQGVLETWFPHVRLPKSTTLARPWSAQDFYEAACVPQKEPVDADLALMQVNGLQASLYPFQRRAVQWLLSREGVRWRQKGKPGLEPYMQSNPTELPVSFTKDKDADGEAFYLSSLFGITTRDISPFLSRQQLRGGILAEEMGLGKTIEMTALVLLHRRPKGPDMVLDPYLGQELLATSATLIVTPSVLSDQWLSELARHAPGLKTLYYPGLKKAAQKKDGIEMSAELLSEHDVVITTYDVLRTELYSALDEPNRSLRGTKQYERVKSPLVQLSWWRVCIDEAQMVENWTTNAAKLAKRIPRINSWGITGTPVKDDVQKDLRGLLNFLRLEPYASDTTIWHLITTADKDSFRKLFNQISMRHTKSLVRSEITIPAQKRYVITMSFTAVEEQHYQNLFEELVAPCGLDTQGNPTRDDWDIEDPAVQNSMRTALDRLRQSALHPEVRNRRNLGRKVGPMRTVEEVLNAMIEQSDGAIRTDQRNLLSLKLSRGQILAEQHQVRQALALWEEVLTTCNDTVSECRDQLDRQVQEVEAAKLGCDLKKGTAGEQSNSTDSGADDHDDVANLGEAKVGEARRRLRSALEIQHRAVFFCANAYFSIKSNEKMAMPNSDEFKRLEELETKHYDLAKAIRQDILEESHGKARKLMEKLANSAAEQDFAVIPESKPVNQKGLETHKIVDALEQLGEALSRQADHLDDWREHVIQLLLKPLVDEENDEITGEEYEDSTKLQDEILVYVQVLRAAIADRQTVITGQKNYLVEHETKAATRMAKDGDGPFPEKLLELFEARDAIKPPSVEGDPLSSLRGLISELRGLTVKLRSDALTGSSRAATELAIVSHLLKLTQQEQTEQGKAAAKMEQEVERFVNILNARLEFYRQLQAVSDMVAVYEGPSDDAALQAVLRQEETLQKKLATAEGKHRYLLNLKDADSNSEEQRICVICQSPFSTGVLTVCGHQFCKECITLWFRAHRNCPVCKRHLHQANLHDIVLKPQQLQSEKNVASFGSPRTIPKKKSSAIYTEFNSEILAKIRDIDLDGPNFTTKVDTLIRHIFWLRESDPGAKSIVFSQYKEFLDVLSMAFSTYRIGFTSFDKAHGIAEFKENPGTEVFILHARAHASGLNLVNASHVFLCEPLLNTALELQAIARVDRIGQQHETTVWLYIVDGTVEESIYNLSVQRRLEHMGQNLKGKSKESTPELLDASLEAANTLELQQAQLSKLMGKDGISGEVVDKKDLWTCLFGHVAKSRHAEEERLISNPVARGFLAAEAADARRRDECDETA